MCRSCRGELQRGRNPQLERDFRSSCSSSEGISSTLLPANAEAGRSVSDPTAAVGARGVRRSRGGGGGGTQDATCDSVARVSVVSVWW